jgi:hypothetical protein
LCAILIHCSTNHYPIPVCAVHPSKAMALELRCILVTPRGCHQITRICKKQVHKKITSIQLSLQKKRPHNYQQGPQTKLCSFQQHPKHPPLRVVALIFPFPSQAPLPPTLLLGVALLPEALVWPGMQRTSQEQRERLHPQPQQRKEQVRQREQRKEQVPLLSAAPLDVAVALGAAAARAGVDAFSAGRGGNNSARGGRGRGRGGAGSAGRGSARSTLGGRRIPASARMQR